MKDFKSKIQLISKHLTLSDIEIGTCVETHYKHLTKSNELDPIYFKGKLIYINKIQEEFIFDLKLFEQNKKLNLKLFEQNKKLNYAINYDGTLTCIGNRHCKIIDQILNPNQKCSCCDIILPHSNDTLCNFCAFISK